MLNPDFIRPKYGERCFSDLPLLVHSLLTGQPEAISHLDSTNGLANQYDAVVFLFVDSFGWRFFERFADTHPFLQRFQQEGVVARWTSQFPSTTTAHVTAIHTGLPVSQSGMYEWTYYEPQLDALISPLLFSFAGTKYRDTLHDTGIDPALLYPSPDSIPSPARRWGDFISFSA